MQNGKERPETEDVDSSNHAEHKRHRDAIFRADASLEQHDVERVEQG